MFAERMGRGLNAAYTTGAGTTTLQGYITGGTDASLSGVLGIYYHILLNNVFQNSYFISYFILHTTYISMCVPSIFSLLFYE